MRWYFLIIILIFYFLFINFSYNSMDYIIDNTKLISDEYVNNFILISQDIEVNTNVGVGLNAVVKTREKLYGLLTEYHYENSTKADLYLFYLIKLPLYDKYINYLYFYFIFLILFFILIIYS